MNKIERYWSGMSSKKRVKALASTGSWRDDYKKKIGEMGGSQEEAKKKP